MIFNKLLHLFYCLLIVSLIVASPSHALLPNDLSDSEITAAIESDLFIDEGVSSHLIDVTTQEGIVTLSGSVDNLLAKERAIKITQTIRGVRSIINKILVHPVERPNEEIQKDIKKALSWDPATDSNEIDVEVNNGLVTLKGEADSWQEKQLASEVAKGVSGVSRVKNEIVLNFKSERPDEEIKADILRRLESDMWVYDNLIQVSVDNGNVKLNGAVKNITERQRAGLLAWVAGVKTVDNSRLNVISSIDDGTKRTGKVSVKSDEEIKKAIETAFSYDFRVNPFKLKIQVERGFVTLEGIVDSLKAKKSAEMDAKYTAGVWGIKNNLKVRPKKTPSDSEITQYVRDALAFHPLVDRYDITINVRNKKVHLYGTVDTAFDKKRAEEVVSRISGVVEVDNHLIITNSWPYKDDQTIKDNIEREYWWSVYVDEDDIFVTVDNGIAKLGGQVDSWNQLLAAVHNAFEGGARSVEARLKVSNDSRELTVHNHYSYNDLETWP